MLDRRALLASSAALLVAPALDGWSTPEQSGAALNALFDRFMKENLDNSPTTVTALGLDTGARAHQKSLIDDSSLAGIAKNKAITAGQLAALKAFNRAALSPKDAVSYDVILYGLKTNAEADARFAYGPGGAGAPYIISQLTGLYSQGPSFLDNQHTIETKADADAYLARLNGFAALLDQETEVTRHDIAMGVVPPDFAL